MASRKRKNNLFRRALFRARKWSHQHLFARDNSPKQLLFICGCQRSGTSILTRSFDLDLASRVYGERGLGDNGGLRLMPWDQIERHIRREAAPFLVAKPLLDSQHAARLLDRFPESKVLWLYRRFPDVASSNKKRFGHDRAMKNLRSLSTPGTKTRWVSENVSDETRRIVTSMLSGPLSNDDANAVFWYVRNVLFYEQRLHENPGARLCSYETLVADPSKTMMDIYAFLGRPYPGDHLVARINARSVNRGKHLPLSGEVRTLCEALERKLQSTFEQQFIGHPSSPGESERRTQRYAAR